MKILVINTVSFTRNGISSVIKDIICANRNIVFDVIVDDLIDETYVDFFKLNGIKTYYVASRWTNKKQYRLDLAKIIKHTHYDIIYIHGNSSSMLVETTIKHDKETKILVHGHNINCSHPLIHKLLMPFFRNTYDLAVACSKEAGEFTFKKDFLVLKNCVDVEKFKFNLKDRDTIRKLYGLNDQKVVLQIGRYNKQKNFGFTIELISMIKDKSIKFILIGDGDEKERIINKSKDLGVYNQILFLNARDDVEKFYSAADLFILPSLYESFGLVLLEAQITGLKCIASNNIPTSVNFTNNIDFNELALEVWANKINEFNFYYERKDYSILASEEGYSFEKFKTESSKILNYFSVE